jgi:hypothetical protein
VRLIYCTDCRFVVNAKDISRHGESFNCDCIGQLQRLAVRSDAGDWTLSDRAEWVTIPDDVFERVNEQCRAAMTVGAGRDRRVQGSQG